MTSTCILQSYLLLFAIYTCTDFTLTWLNLRKSISSRDSIPAFFQNWITIKEFNRSLDYTIAKQKLNYIRKIFSALILLVCIFTGFFGIFDTFISTLTDFKYLQGCFFIFGLSIASTLVSLPFSYYSQFHLEEEYGFNQMTKKLWLSDLLKSMVLQILIGVPILFILFYLIDTLGDFWWISGFLFIAGFQLLLMFIYPVFIAPLFNTFSPLEEKELKDKIDTLAKEANFNTSGIFLMDGSKRSSHGNAYFTGFGKNKRIVLFDTLVNALSTDEILSVLAHEIGHEKKLHIKKNLVLSLSMLFLFFWLLSFLIHYLPLFQAFGFHKTSYHGALILFGFITEPILFYINPLFSMLSRHFEFEADRFAVDLVKGSKSLQSALLQLSKKSLSNLVPHPWYSFFHYSHPTLSERLPAMEKYATQQGYQ